MRILTGTDIIEIQRVQTAIERQGGAFLQKVYTPDEIAYCEARGVGKYESYAARFAAKEAVSKAFGTGICADVPLKDIEIRNNERGKPYVSLYGKAHRYYQEVLQGIQADLSLSHCDSHAVAFVSILAD